MQIYHKPWCAKSRAGLNYLQEKGYTFGIVKYLEETVSAEELKSIITKTSKPITDFIRTQEKDYKESYKGKNLSDDE